jgi:hypothetical protein
MIAPPLPRAGDFHFIEDNGSVPCAERVKPAVQLVEALVADMVMMSPSGKAGAPLGGASGALSVKAMRAVERKQYGERMRNRIGVSVALGLASFLLAGCAIQTPPTWVKDVCNIHASWVSADRPQADEKRLANSLRNAVPAGADAATAVSARTVVDAVMDGDREAVESASDQLVATCTEAGAKPPEG